MSGVIIFPGKTLGTEVVYEADNGLTRVCTLKNEQDMLFYQEQFRLTKEGDWQIYNTSQYKIHSTLFLSDLVESVNTEFGLEFKELATVAADWWTAQIAGLAKKDNGDRSGTGGLAMMLGMINAADNEPSLEAIQKFNTLLVKRFCYALAEHPYQHVGCDYHPDGSLSFVAQIAGIHSSRFPWKTSMWLRSDEVKVRCGYGADEVTIYPVTTK